MENKEIIERLERIESEIKRLHKLTLDINTNEITNIQLLNDNVKSWISDSAQTILNVIKEQNK